MQIGEKLFLVHSLCSAVSQTNQGICHIKLLKRRGKKDAEQALRKTAFTSTAVGTPAAAHRMFLQIPWRICLGSHSPLHWQPQ